MTKTIEIYKTDTAQSTPLPYANEGIHAGFPSPAQDYMDATIDLNRELIKNPASTFCGRVIGDSMLDENIKDGDVLVIDKSLEPQDGDLAVCFIDGEFTLKRIKIIDKEHGLLLPSNSKYPPIPVTPENNFRVWGIVTYTIMKNRRRRD